MFIATYIRKQQISLSFEVCQRIPIWLLARIVAVVKFVQEKVESLWNILYAISKELAGYTFNTSDASYRIS